MGDFHTELNDSLIAFIGEQKIFFTATSPEEGRINLSPKGIDTFRCIDKKTVAYLDLTGSSNETAAHLYENSRLTIMFCAFSGRPLILRLYGRGRVVRQQDDEWQKLSPLFDPLSGRRQIVLLEIDSLQKSCGFGVPLFEFKGERETLLRWAEKKGEAGVKAYWEENNTTSIDGLPTRILDE